MSTVPEDLTSFVYASHAAALQLAHLTAQDKKQVLLSMAEAIKQHRDYILEANTLDLESSREMSIPDLVLEWLKLTPERLQSTIECLNHLVLIPDPLANRMLRDGSKRVPLGAVAFVHEAFPQLGLIAAGMCLKVGNSLILKSGNESSHTTGAMVEIARDVIKNYNLPEAALTLAPQGSSTKDLVTQEKYLRLVIPYGRPSFVQQISKQATVSVLPTAMGNCYLYVSPSSNLEFAQKVITTSHCGDPDPVNAIEKAVVHRYWLEAGFSVWIDNLQKQGFTIRGCDATVAHCRTHADKLQAEVSSEGQWNHAYLDNTIAIKVVNNIDEAIAWINQYSSGHADVILTDSLKETNQFANQVNSSTIYINACNRFVRNSGTGEDSNVSVLLGMSSLKTRGAASRHPGTINLDALTTTKRIITS